MLLMAVREVQSSRTIFKFHENPPTGLTAIISAHIPKTVRAITNTIQSVLFREVIHIDCGKHTEHVTDCVAEGTTSSCYSVCYT
jgi:hypothetical protein